MPDSYHIPVMLDEVLKWLVTDQEGVYADLTFGGGGHASSVLGLIKLPHGRLYGFDADAAAIEHGRVTYAGFLQNELILTQAYFSEACRYLQDHQVGLDGVFMDLGVSSRQLDSDQIGLSYRQTMPLDMRFDQQSDRPSASELVNTLSAEDLATTLRRFGEEPAAWTIAQAIVKKRKAIPIRTTTDLRDVIADVIPDRFLTKTLSRVFQGLRIAVNDELEELRFALEHIVDLLKPNGRIVVLTYHSLEDRLVKDRFRWEERDCVCPPEVPVCQCGKVKRLNVLTRKPLTPTDQEIARNPRARSAKLRVAEKV